MSEAISGSFAPASATRAHRSAHTNCDHGSRPRCRPALRKRGNNENIRVLREPTGEFLMKRILPFVCALMFLACGSRGVTAMQNIDECYVDGHRTQDCNIDTVLPANYGSYVTFMFRQEDGVEDELTFFFWNTPSGRKMWRVYTRKRANDQVDYVTDTPDNSGAWRIEKRRNGIAYLCLRNERGVDKFVFRMPLLSTVPGSG
jgi:hypothetical protein